MDPQAAAENLRLRTLVWPNGTNFAPEFLRDKLKIAV
jgi:hypothetical protein